MQGPCTDQADVVLRVADDLPSRVREGDTIDLEDARGRRRCLSVRKVIDGLVFAELERTAYVIPGTVLRLQHDGIVTEHHIGQVPTVEQSLVLKVGDTLVLTPDSVAGRPAVCDERGHVLDAGANWCHAPSGLQRYTPGRGRLVR